ncbi:MAG: MFS transporter [Candidatus Omnitrophica bacterium]|nr:MFS transporter [Candidatus Omnitrophota bacterium]MDD5592238.1 MFS transporter [Candidatus Omnitrophota bacterium]
MLSSLKVRNYRLYWLGMFISLIGTWVQAVAQSWLVFQITDSAFLLGFVGFLGSIPVFLLSLFGGVVADRVNKKIILLFTQSAFMILAFFLAALTQMKVITPGQIMFIAVLNGMVMAFDAPSRQAVVVELVGREHLFNAIALNSIAFNSSRIIGPALAGVLIAGISMSGCFYINAISFLPLIIILLSIKIHNNPRAPGNNTVARDLAEGLRFIKNSRLILVLITMVGISSLFGISYVILMPVFAERILKVGAGGLGILMSSSGFGALIAALVLAALGDFKYKGRLLVFSSLVFSLALILFSLSKIFLLSVIALMLIGWGSVMAIAVINTLLQVSVKDEFRGRVMSVFMFTFAGFMPFGNLLAGILSQAWGVSLTVMVSGIICAIFFTVINIAYPDIRRQH